MRANGRKSASEKEERDEKVRDKKREKRKARDR